jgi:hypothetical protein
VNRGTNNEDQGELISVGQRRRYCKKSGFTTKGTKLSARVLVFSFVLFVANKMFFFAKPSKKRRGGNLLTHPVTTFFEEFRDQKSGAAHDDGGCGESGNQANRGLFPARLGRWQLVTAKAAEDGGLFDFFAAEGARAGGHNQNL